MCGIIGVLSTEGAVKSHVRKKFFTQALYADALRGFDSTGIFCAGELGKSWEKGVGCDTIYHKRALAASDFLSMDITNSIIKGSEKYSFMIGHNRWATKGGVRDDTSHPFDFEKVIGVHNGTLLSTYNLKGGRGFEVDSQALYNAFNSEGHRDTLPKLDGAFALAWYNKVTNNLYLCRNEERPLHLATEKGSDTVYIASEREMLLWLLSRNKIEVEDIKSLGVGELLTFSAEKVSDYTTEKIKLKEPTVYGYMGYGYQSNVRNLPANNYKPAVSKSPATRSLEEAGLIIGDILEFKAKSIAKYQGSPNKGRVVGSLIACPDQEDEISASAEGTEVTAHNLEIDEYLGREGELFLAELSGAYLDKSGGLQLTTRSEIFSVEEEEEEEGEEEASEGGEGEASEGGGVSTFYGKSGEIISPSAWRKLVEGGCSMCTGNIYEEETGTLTWTEVGDPLCKTCTQEMGWEELSPCRRH